jgi:Lipase (class 3)
MATEKSKGKMTIFIEPENADNPKHADNVASLNKLDRAFKNSLLSYAIYDKNKSWFESWAQIKAMNPQAHIPATQMVETASFFTEKSRAHDRAFATVIANTFTPVPLNMNLQDNHRSDKYLYDFDSQHKNGVYKAMGNLSAACAMKSQNPDGTYTLHISFRGTDSDAQPFFRFLKKAYLDMAAYYESFKPFEKACIEYAKDPANNISKIEVSGHSLGGAMVQHFFRSKELEEANLPQKMEGITFGSPHALSNTLYAFLPALRHLVRHGNVKAMVNTIFNTLSGQALMDDLVNKDDRITQYQHNGDLVPKLAGALMTKTGHELITLPDVASKETIVDHLLTNADKSYYAQHYRNMEKPETKFSAFKKMTASAVDTIFNKPVQLTSRFVKTVYHDMARYAINIENQAEELNFKDKITKERRFIFHKTDPAPTITQYNKACMAIGITTKGNKRLEGEDVNFNEYKLSSPKFLELTDKFSAKVIADLRQLMQKKNTPSPTI